MASSKAATAATSSQFGALGLDDRLGATLAELGYEEPTPIQREAIPPLLEGKDLIGQAATGTGKTAAFALPMLQRLASLGDKRQKPAGLVLVPTRELAVQVAEALHRYGARLGISVLPIYGGQAYGPQLRALDRGVDVVVATPGRALDHINRGTLNLGNLAIIVLDEADEMLDMGFAEDIESIIGQTPPTRQTALFSATLAPRIAAIAKRHLNDPTRIKVGDEKVAAGEMPRVRQTAYIVPRGHKLAALGRVLDAENPTAAIIFCRRRTEVDELTETLASRGYRGEALHGGMTQEQRSRVMKRFRAGNADLLIATDVAARGLDIDHLTHVVNFDVPCEPESYVHRIGRVGRAGREGVAITLAEPREHRLLQNLERATKQKIEMARVPTVADLRARRLDITRGNLREAILGGDAELDQFRVVVESLADEFDVMQVAMAAVKLAHLANNSGGDEEGDEHDLPEPIFTSDHPARGGGRGGRPGRDGGGYRNDGPPRGGDGPGPGPRRRPSGPGPSRAGYARLFIGAGREAGVRPQDLVGAITGESGIDGRDVGGIEISDRFSLVEVAENSAETVIAALRRAKIKGKKAIVRRDRAEG
jgi:ATP-dependent RNA helicase DeaD